MSYRRLDHVCKCSLSLQPNASLIVTGEGGEGISLAVLLLYPPRYKIGLLLELINLPRTNTYIDLDGWFKTTKTATEPNQSITNITEANLSPVDVAYLGTVVIILNTH
jgi:hypothetical protein